MKILLVLVKTMGDVILINNIVDKIRKKYPKSKIDVCVNSIYKDIIDENPYINDILLCDDWLKNWGTIFNFILNKNYDEYMIPQQLTGEDNIWHQVDLYRHNHLLNFYLYRCRLPLVDITEQKLKMYVKDKIEFEPIIKGYGDYCIIHTTSGANIKNWNIDNFQKLALKIKKEFKIKVLQLGIKNDNALIFLENIIDCRDKYTLKEQYLLCKNAKFMVGIDSGPSFIAGASGCPTIKIHGPSNIITSGGFGKNIYNILAETDERCKNKRCHGIFKGQCKYTKPCVNNITVDNILIKIKEVVK